MIIDSTNAALSTNIPEGSGTNFTIAASAHAFQILSSSIYQHKIAAIVREICTNAFDSHVQAGKEDVPFSIVLPNDMHPYFEVEDFGVGMSVQDAMVVYTVYFKSTKNDSNEVAGGIGIGGKSVFSYTRQFNIRIRKDGEENLAVIYVDASGLPRLDVIHTCATTEQNGVKVSVPVEAKDYRTFAGEARFFLSFYPVTPVFNTPTDVNFENVHQKLQQDGYAFVKNTSNSYVDSALASGNFYAVMSPVPYMVNINTISPDDNNTIQLLRQAVYRGGCCFVKFDIGELSVSASRESLSLDERTVARLREKFTEVVTKIQKSIKTLSEDKTKHPLVLYKNFIEEFGGDFYINLVAPNSRLSTAFRKVKVPNFGRHTIRQGWRRSGNFFNPHNHSMDVFANIHHGGEVKVIVIDCDKKLVRDLFLEQDTYYVYRDEKNGLSELRKSRIEKIYNIKIKTVLYSDLYKEYLAKRREARANGTTKTTRVKHATTSVVASGVYTFDDSSVDSFSSVRTELTDATYKVAHESRWEVDIGGKTVEREDLWKVTKALYSYFKIDGMKVVIENGQNKKRIQDNNVKCLSTLVDRFVAETEADIEAAVKSSTAKELLRELKYSYSDATVASLCNVGSKHIPDEVREVLPYLKGLSELDLAEIPSCMHVFYNSDKKWEWVQYVRDVYSRLRPAYDDVRSILEEKYPLLSRNYYGLPDDDDENKELTHARMYVKMIDDLEEDATIECEEEECVK